MLPLANFPSKPCQIYVPSFVEQDLEKVEVSITDDQEEHSWWVWVSVDMVSTNAEEKSGIDNENYILVGEEHVVDGVANFMARCIVANPKALNLTPQELLKGAILKNILICSLDKSIGGINKVKKMEHMLVPRPGNLETCCSWGSSFEQTGLESSLKRARQLSSFFKQNM